MAASPIRHLSRNMAFLDDALEDALEATFPASDPPAIHAAGSAGPIVRGKN